MNTKTKNLFGGIISVLLIYIVVMTCIDVLAFYRPFYNWQHDKLKTSEKVGMSKNDLYESMDVLLDYLQGYRDDIEVSFEVHGEMREIYTTREKKHMVDVKHLYQDAMLIRNIMVGVVLFLLLILYVDNKKELLYTLCRSYYRTFILFVMMVGTLLLYALSDFTRFWTNFHHVFFKNDLWLLDPRYSIMINMLEESLFFSLVFMIAFITIGILVILFIVSRRYVKNKFQ